MIKTCWLLTGMGSLKIRFLMNIYLFYSGSEMRGRRSSKSGQYRCGHYSKTFCSRRSLREHEALHNPLHSFTCELCGKSFALGRRLHNHVRQAHGEKRHICTQCGKALGSAANLQNHLYIHSGVLRYNCSYCGLAFRSHNGLESHTRIHDGKNFKCQFCPKVYMTNQVLQ